MRLPQVDRGGRIQLFDPCGTRTHSRWHPHTCTRAARGVSGGVTTARPARALSPLPRTRVVRCVITRCTTARSTPWSVCLCGACISYPRSHAPVEPVVLQTQAHSRSSSTARPANVLCKGDLHIVAHIAVRHCRCVAPSSMVAGWSTMTRSTPHALLERPHPSTD